MSCYVRLRGLPWSVTHQEILDFLKNVNVVGGTKGIHMILSRWDGKNTGEAFVELASAYDEKEAFKQNRLTIGHRYIEIFSATQEEVTTALKSHASVSSNVVKLRGLPYSITEEQIENFFHGLNLKRNREGVLITLDRRGRATGEAYVQFESVSDTELALLRNREKIGHRYIEIFRSSMAEMRRQFGNRPSPYDIKDRVMRNREDFGSGNCSMLRDKGFGGDNHNALGAHHSGNGLSISGLGMVKTQGGYNLNDTGGNFNRPGNNNNIGFLNNATSFNPHDRKFNKDIFWNFGLLKNMRGQILNDDQTFEANREFVNGFGGNNRNTMGACHSGNGLNLSGSMIFNNQGGYNHNDTGGNIDGPGNNNNIGLSNNPTSYKDRDRKFNKDMFWNSGLNKNMRQQIADDGQTFDANIEFVNGNDNNNFNDGFGRGKNRLHLGLGNKIEPGTFNFRNNKDFQADNNVFCVHMRGLPYNTFENEVFEFFDPVRPSNVNIIFNSKGLHSGSADAFFYSYDDAQIAMKKHMEQIGSRYIELFFDGKTRTNSTEF